MINIQNKEYCPTLEEIAEYVEGFFTVLVVIGRKEKDMVEALLSEYTPKVRDIYQQTKTGNGQKWLMIELEDRDEVYDDVLRLIDIRKG